jgi:hypothetical protein
VSATGRLVDRGLAVLHRWAGVVLCVPFVVWFATGIILHYVPFPGLSAVDHARAADVIDTRRVGVPASTAVRSVPDAERMRLVAIAGRPLYVVEGRAGRAVTWADDGSGIDSVDATTASAIAARFARAEVRSIEGPFDYDQWVVHQKFDALRPYYRARIADPAATELYVSARTGEVVQRTTGRERAWNYLGAVTHWIYFTPVRKHWSYWDLFVWTLSLVALLAASIGVWLGIVRAIANSRRRRGGLSPYRGWLKWHHVLGIFGSVLTIAWMLSGWLSMDHGRLFPKAEATASESTAMRGGRLSDAAAATGLASLAALGATARISWGIVGARPLVHALAHQDGTSRVVMLDQAPSASAALPESLLLSAARAAWPGAVAAPDAALFDPVYRDAESVGSDVLRLREPGPDDTFIYVDRASGDPLAVVGPGRRAYDTVYYAMHTFRWPGLAEHPTARSIVVTLLALAGLALAITSLVVGYRRLSLTVRSRVPTTDRP